MPEQFYFQKILSLKVIIIGPAHPLRGGIADFNEALCKGFHDAGMEAGIYSFSFQYPSFLFPGTSQFSNDAAPDLINIQTTIHSLNPLSWRSTASKIIAEKPDFVIVRYWLPFMAPALGSICRMIRKKGIKVIAITDNVIPHEKRIGDKALTKYFLRSCDAFVAMSRSVMKEVESFIPDAKAIFLPHPIYNIFGDEITKQKAREKFHLPMDQKIILFFGFIRAYKGLDLLLEAMADERIKQLNIKLIVAGEFYEDSKPYMDTVSRLGLTDSVEFHSSFIPKDEVKYYFCASDMVVQPYRNATQSGITQIAYHFGKPMLVTNVGGLPEIVSDGVVGYVTDTEARAIATALYTFYTEGKEQVFSANVIHEKERFTWDTFIKGIMNLYEKLS